MNASDPTLKPRRHRPVHQRPLGAPFPGSPFASRETLKRASTAAIKAELRKRAKP